MEELQPKAPRSGIETAIYFGLDVHKDSSSVAYAEAGRQSPEFLTRADHTPAAVKQLAHQVSACGAALWRDEAGPCGYALQS